MSGDNLALGFIGSSRFSHTRGRTSDGQTRSGVRYPSPFFDISQTWLPSTMKQLLQWCRYYYMVNPLIHTVVHKMSEYPITEVVIEETKEKLKTTWQSILDNLRLRAFQVETGLDYNTYGICLVTIHFPFMKYLVCRSCKTKHKASKTQYKWRNLNYYLGCKKCGHEGPANVFDHYIKDVRRIRLQRWNPEYVFIDLGFDGSDPVYTFELPKVMRADLMIGKKHLLDTIPDVFVEAVKRNKNIRFSNDNVFVLRRPIISQKERGWGMPLILPVLKDTFYLQILRKAQEQIAQEHIVPLRVIFPQANGQTSDPYTTINLDNWKNTMETEFAKWKYDQNYIPIMPLPIGNQTIGGDGKALLLHQEMQAWSEQIVAGMGVPSEFVWGGMSYSGSNVSMRMLENNFIAYRIDQEHMLNNFIIRSIANYMGIPPVKCRMRRFKMADDLQRTSFFFQLNQAQKVSDQTLLEESDFDIAQEEKRREAELDRQLAFNRKQQLAMAAVQGEMALVQAKYQAQAQQLMAPPAPDAGAQIAGVGPDGQPIQAADMAGQGGAPGEEGGQQGAMIPGEQADPGMPQGTSVSQEEGQQVPTTGVPDEMSSPLQAGQTTGGGYNLIYLAKRAAAALKQMDPVQKNAELNKMRGMNPPLYQATMRFLVGATGSQEDALNPIQSPLPTQKPERRMSHVGT
jgi:hypothetical protein